MSKPKREIRLAKIDRTSPLGGKINFPEHKNYKKAKTIKTKKQEVMIVRNPLNQRESKLTLYRTGTTDKALGKILADKQAPKEKKEAAISLWMFERGMESASFLADIFQYKGQHAKSTQAFKSQMRKDWEIFLEVLIRYLHAMGDEDTGIQRMGDLRKSFKNLSSELATVMRKLTEDRMKEKGYGIYVDHHGQVYEMDEKGFDEAIAKDRKEIIKKKHGRASNPTD